MKLMKLALVAGLLSSILGGTAFANGRRALTTNGMVEIVRESGNGWVQVRDLDRNDVYGIYKSGLNYETTEAFGLRAGDTFNYAAPLGIMTTGRVIATFSGAIVVEWLGRLPYGVGNVLYSAKYIRQ